MKDHKLPHEDIQLPNAATLERLLAHRGDYCVSIYFPTEEAGPGTDKNRIRFKNSLTEAETRLRTAGANDDQVRTTLAPIADWEGDSDRWAHQGHGLAIFLCDGEVETYRLPAPVEALTLVGDRYHLLRLLQLTEGGSDHYVLCLSQDGARLWHSDTYSMRPVTVDFPSLEDVLGYQLTEPQQSAHSTSNTGGRGIFHGHGAGTDEERKKEIRKFCSVLDAKVREYLPRPDTPLVVVAVEYVGAIYRDASSHGNVAGIVAGSPDAYDREELHKRALDVAQEKLSEPLKRDLERLLDGQHTDQTASGLTPVMQAATEGRVELLFLDQSKTSYFGAWDESSRKVGPAPDEPRSEHAILDWAARETLAKGGRLRFVAAEQMPSDEPVAAVLRY